MKTNITACLVIYNEEKIIERALKSIKGIVDEIIVVHDGLCSDNSLKICRKYGAKIFIRKFAGAAEAHRVWMYKKVKTDWILQIDADEFLSKPLAKKIPQLAQRSDIAGFEFIWPYWNGQKYLTKNWPWKLALFQTKKFHYLGALHEAILIKGSTEKIPLILEHRPTYDNFTFSVFKTKTSRWIKIHAKTFLADPKTLPAYPKKESNQQIHYIFLKDHPLFWALPIGLYHFTGTYFLGGYKEGLAGFRACFMMGLYYTALCFEIWKIKK